MWAKLLRFTWCLSALALIADAGEASAATLRGTVTNGTGGAITDSVGLGILAFGGVDREWSLRDVREGFVLDSLPGGADVQFVLQLFYQDVSYSTSFAFRSESGDTTLTLVVYESTNDAENAVSLTEAELDFSQSESGLRIDHILRFGNALDPPRAIVSHGEGTMRVGLPIQVTDPSRVIAAVSTGIVPVQRPAILTDDPRVIAMDYPLRPGQTTAAVSIEVAYANAFAYDAVALYDIPALFVVVPGGARVNGEGFVPVSGEEESGHIVYQKENLVAGDAISFLVTGSLSLPETMTAPGAPQTETRVIVGDARFTSVQWYAMGAVLIILIGSMLVAGGSRE